MRCISPLSIRRDGQRQTVPCGKCGFCLQSKRADWSFRLVQETKVASSAHFLTLTYEDDKLPFNQSSGLPELDKKHYQLFTKRLRKEQSTFSEEKIRYYSVGEYGTKTERPHYHSIMFNLSPLLENRLVDIWSHGHVKVGDVTPASIHYVTKYVINRYDDYNGREPPFALMSRKPALGRNYLDTHAKWHKKGLKNYTKVNGQLGRLPRYYREKLFTQLEREKMALESITQSDLDYWEEVERLSKYHPNPEQYYEERIQFQHEGIKEKVNKLNKF